MRGVRRTVLEVPQLGQLLFRQEPLPTAALDAVRQGRASEARSPAAGGAEASGIEARMGRDREPGSIHESPVLASARRRHVTPATHPSRQAGARARQPSVTSGALSGCQRSLGLALPRFISRNPAAMGARRAPTGLLALSKPHPGVSSRSGPWTSEVRLYEAISVAGTPPTNSQAFQSLSNG